jgi:hypothetical protein
VMRRCSPWRPTCSPTASRCVRECCCVLALSAARGVCLRRAARGARSSQCAAAAAATLRMCTCGRHTPLLAAAAASRCAR